MASKHVGIGQTVQYNRDRYLADLPHASRGGGWDGVILTAGTVTQAAYYQRQIDQRRRRGLLPPFTEFRVVPDPPGIRIGSGGSTLLALGHLASLFKQPRRHHRTAGIAEVFRGRKFLILHSGGESRRLPMYSGLGKLFARVPLALDGGVSTLFDEFLISLSGAPRQFREGVLVASGDVLLLFDNMQLRFNSGGVVGVSMPAPPATACRHGVYLADDHGRVRRFLHKVAPEALEQAGALRNGSAQIDTGIVWFDVATVSTLIETAGLAPGGAPDAPSLRLAEHPQPISLYGDLLAIMATETQSADYLNNPGDDGAPPSPDLRAVRTLLWERLRGTDFHVTSLPDAQFIHFGTCAEYRQALLSGTRPDAELRWPARVAAVIPATTNTDAADGSAWLNSLARGVVNVSGTLIEDAFLGGGITATDGLISRLQTAAVPITLPPGAVLFQAPVRLANHAATATFVLGLHDNPKIPLASGGSFLNRPWSEWIADGRLEGLPLWPADWPLEQQTLWHAALFPVCTDRDESLRRALRLATQIGVEHGGNHASKDCGDGAGERLSLAEALAAFDTQQAITEAMELEDRIAGARFSQAVLQGNPMPDCISGLSGETAAFGRRIALAVADARDRNANPLETIRTLYCAGEALSQQGHAATQPESRQQAGLYRDEAFERLAVLIRAHTPRPVADTGRWRLTQSNTTFHAAARLDFGGGWSDTPPFSLCSGGTVLNAAILLNGKLPIRVCVERLPRPVITLCSRDLEMTITTDRTASILDYRDPADPLALHKAALVLCGAVPETPTRVSDLFTDGAGLRVTTDIAVPKGSGLGTSSILAGALLAALYRAGGRERESHALFDDILNLEQMLTTGGGWQDQVGGLTPGIKLTVSAPGIPQQLSIAPVALDAAVSAALDRRLLLIYTGRRRLAKGILRTIMGRYLANDQVVKHSLQEIQVLARAMLDALRAGDLDTVGQLMSRHWEINKQMDAGSTNPGIDALFMAMQPHVAGAKLAGAGGGGFIEAISRDDDPQHSQIRRCLQADFPEAALWECRITTEPLQMM